MTTFVLVHGAWHGGWCWKFVTQLLQAQGHRVFIPTLTGLADKSHLLTPDINLETHVTDVVNLIKWEELEEVALCGHSYGGMVITGVASQIPDKLSALIYLDAFLPEHGKSLRDYTPADQSDATAKAAAETSLNTVPPIPAAKFRIRDENQAWVDSQCTPQPFGCMDQPVKRTVVLEDIAKCTYIRAMKHDPSNFIQFQELTDADPRWHCRTVDSGHDVMVDDPEELAELLVEAAA